MQNMFKNMLNMQNMKKKISMHPAYNFIFSIFSILLYAKYAEYTRWSIFVAYYFAYSTYYIAYNMLNIQNNMHIILHIQHIILPFHMLNIQNNMQAWILICRILHRVYFAYSTYICTPHFADATLPLALATRHSPQWLATRHSPTWLESHGHGWVQKINLESKARPPHHGMGAGARVALLRSLHYSLSLLICLNEYQSPCVYLKQIQYALYSKSLVNQNKLCLDKTVKDDSITVMHWHRVDGLRGFDFCFESTNVLLDVLHHLIKRR